MTDYLYSMWDVYLKLCMLDDLSHQVVDTKRLVHSALFNRTSSRRENVQLLEFIHGRALRFNNFGYTVKKSKTRICKLCRTEFDSPSHQLFQCSAYTGPCRESLVKLLNGDVGGYQFKIMFCCEKELNCAFRNMVNFIYSVDSLDNGGDNM